MTYLKQAWALWLKFGHFMGNIIGRIILVIFYFTIALPFAIGLTFFSDPLDLKNTSEKFWRSRRTPPASLDAARQQFIADRAETSVS